MCIMLNELTHEDAPFNSRLELTAGSVEYGPDEGKRVKDPGQLPYLYTYSAGFSELCRFFDFLKTNNVYDNTKIIIVADHGKEYKNAYFDENGMERFNPLLLIKERNERGSLRISDKFMTNADAPVEALSETGGLESGANRRLARPVLFDGYEIIACETFGNLKANYNDRFKIRKSRKLIYPDIFKSSSWENWKEGN